MDRLIALSLVLCSCSLFVPAEREAGGQLVLHDPSAATVQLVGDWNRWGGLEDPGEVSDPRSGAMEFSGGYWRGAPPPDLERGRYRYAFLVNGGELRRDPANPETALYRGHTVSLLVID